MSPNGRRAWRRAAKKLRRKMGRRWRSPNKWSEKRWSELVPDLEAHRAHVTGAWFRRHGFAELDPRYKIRQYIGLWGTVDGDGVEYAVKPKPFTARSLVGMTMGARKRKAWRDVFYKDGRAITESLNASQEMLLSVYNSELAKYRIGQKLRPCAGCLRCQCQTAFDAWPELGEELAKDHPTCDGSGVLPSRKDKT